MNYRIEEKEAFHIVGFYKRVSIQFDGVNPEIAAMWESLDPLSITRLKQLSNVAPLGLLSASTNFPEGRIYSEWFQSSNYEQVEGPEILWNESKDVTSPTFKSEIWIPVMKK